VTQAELLDALKTVEDPELMMNIVDLGLVYRIEDKEDHVEIDYTLTTPGCPAADFIEEQIVEKLEERSKIPVEANLVWNPPWGPEYMSDEAKIALGFPV
jgi:metal-sulfur cluster biosynthetic enzyme